MADNQSDIANFEVACALRASTSFPIVFKPVEVKVHENNITACGRTYTRQSTESFKCFADYPPLSASLNKLSVLELLYYTTLYGRGVKYLQKVSAFIGGSNCNLLDGGITSNLPTKYLNSEDAKDGIAFYLADGDKIPQRGGFWMGLVEAVSSIAINQASGKSSLFDSNHYSEALDMDYQCANEFKNNGGVISVLNHNGITTIDFDKVSEKGTRKKYEQRGISAMESAREQKNALKMREDMDDRRGRSSIRRRRSRRRRSRTLILW